MQTGCAWVLILALLPSNLGGSASSELPIRRSSVMSSWQSSFRDGQTCFYNRSEAEERDALRNNKSSHRFIHSAARNQSNDTFHWFAVRLPEPVLIRSVTVKGREDDQIWTFNRIIGLEIWTSNCSCQLFTGDHCNSRDRSAQLRVLQPEWRLCGVVRRPLDSLKAAETITVPCDSGTQRIRYVLVRKDVSDKHPQNFQDDDVMSLSDLRLQIEQPGDLIEINHAQSTVRSETVSPDQQPSLNETRFSAVIALATTVVFNAPVVLDRSRSYEPQSGVAEQTAPDAEYENSGDKLETAQELNIA